MAPVPVAPPVVVAADPTGAVKLSADEIARIQKIKGEFDQIYTADALKLAWIDAQKLDLDETLTAAYQAKGEALDLQWLLPALPGVRVDYVGEGTMVQLVLDPELWRQKAIVTPPLVDDALIALLKDTYGSATPSGTPSWDLLTWDYGGCSALGNGSLVALLKETEAAADVGPLFKDEIAAIRKRALDAVLVGDPGFQYCDPGTTEATPDAALQREAQQILEQVKLSDEEKAALTARIPNLHGEAFSGG